MQAGVKEKKGFSLRRNRSGDVAGANERSFGDERMSLAPSRKPIPEIIRTQADKREVLRGGRSNKGRYPRERRAALLVIDHLEPVLLQFNGCPLKRRPLKSILTLRKHDSPKNTR